MRMIEITERSPDLCARLLAIWEQSVRATHTFLSLFLNPALRRQGYGRKLVQKGITEYGVSEVTVNEQNPEAIKFYEAMGFRTYKRTDRDEQGGPYPLYYMKLENYHKND